MDSVMEVGGTVLGFAHKNIAVPLAFGFHDVV
jgi:hypothetical protein